MESNGIVLAWERIVLASRRADHDKYHRYWCEHGRLPDFEWYFTVPWPWHAEELLHCFGENLRCKLVQKFANAQNQAERDLLVTKAEKIFVELRRQEDFTACMVLSEKLQTSDLHAYFLKFLHRCY